VLIPTTLVTSSLTGQQLAYAEVTGNVAITATTEATADVVVTAPSVSLDGGTQIIIEFYCTRVESPGGGTGRGTFAVLYQSVDGGAATALGFFGENFTTGGESQVLTMFCRRVLTPAAGAYVFSIRGFVTTGTGDFVGGTGVSAARQPLYIRITRG